MTQQMIWLGLIALVVIGLAASATMQDAGTALGQEKATPTPTPTATPASGEDTETVVREDCVEDAETGELTCTETTEPLAAQDRPPRGGGGGGGGGDTTDPSLTVSGLASTLEKGESDTFVLWGNNLNTSQTYYLRVRRTSGDNDVGFNSDCSYSQSTVTVPAGRSYFSHTFTLHGCDTNGATVTSELRQGSTVIDDESQFVSVVDPQVAISNLVTSIEEGPQRFLLGHGIEPGFIEQLLHRTHLEQ